MDETQWLPKGVSIITPERQAMLSISIEYDHEGLVKYARAEAKPTVIQYLYRQHIIDDLEYADGRDYQMWREMFRAFCSNQRMTASYDLSPRGSQDGNGERERAYSALIRHIPRDDQMMIEYCIDALSDKKGIRVANHYADKFQRSFNRLGAAMEIIRTELDIV